MARSPRRHLSLLAVAVATTLLAGAACSGDDGGGDGAAGASTTATTEPAEGPDAVRLNEIQVVGSHNSYKLRPREEVGAALEALVPALFETIDYGHLPLAEQLGDHGVRQLEIDVMADPDGGLYATPAALEILEIDEPVDPVLEEPGFKVAHTQDIDFETTCLTFVTCLEEVEAWSSATPGHLPVMILVETKTGSLEEDAGTVGIDLDSFGVEFATAPAMTAELFDDLEAEILSVFDRERILAPDDVRGERDTLEEAVLTDGWPTVESSRGKVLFALVDTGASADVYREGAPALEGRLAFTSSRPGEPDAAFVRVDDSLEDGADLEAWARAGYLIRTRTDEPGIHAPAGDTTLRDSALASGAHHLSTDYYVEDPDLGTGFVVELPGGVVARCNPVTARPTCDDDALLE